ncbi:plastocyanin/azurin family copper-binding protein [Pontibacillus yanchengensis]|nr:plastocyanin/azurin family copper-binding protein [Pontibacillus yanchengensis]
MLNKKRLGLLLSGMTVFILIFAACGNSSSNNDTAEEDADSQEETNENEQDSNETEKDQDEQAKEKDDSSSQSEEEDSSNDSTNEDTNKKDDKVIEVSAYEMEYDPSNITLKKGKEYEIVLKNDGTMFHDLTSSELDAEITFMGDMPGHPDEVSLLNNLMGVDKVYANGGDDHSEEQETNSEEDGHHGDSHDDGHGDQSLHMNAKSGQTVRIKFIPKEVGEYEFFCSVEGHKEAGMVGTFKVVE